MLSRSEERSDLEGDLPRWEVRAASRVTTVHPIPHIMLATKVVIAGRGSSDELEVGSPQISDCPMKGESK